MSNILNNPVENTETADILNTDVGEMLSKSVKFPGVIEHHTVKVLPNRFVPGVFEKFLDTHSHVNVIDYANVSCYKNVYWHEAGDSVVVNCFTRLAVKNLIEDINKLNNILFADPSQLLYSNKGQPVSKTDGWFNTPTSEYIEKKTGLNLFGNTDETQEYQEYFVGKVSCIKDWLNNELAWVKKNGPFFDGYFNDALLINFTNPCRGDVASHQTFNAEGSYFEEDTMHLANLLGMLGVFKFWKKAYPDNYEGYIPLYLKDGKFVGTSTATFIFGELKELIAFVSYSLEQMKYLLSFENIELWETQRLNAIAAVKEGREILANHQGKLED